MDISQNPHEVTLTALTVRTMAKKKKKTAQGKVFHCKATIKEVKELSK